jgi:hypothetical protein
MADVPRFASNPLCGMGGWPDRRSVRRKETDPPNLFKGGRTVAKKKAAKKAAKKGAKKAAKKK